MKSSDKRLKHIYEYVDQKGRQASERLDEARLILLENPKGPARETVIELDAAARRIAQARAIARRTIGQAGRKEDET